MREEDWTGISVFVAAAEAGSFATAARRLNLSRSAVGKAIGRLEERLGARLFQRTTRSLALTGEGQFFFERCLRALAELRAGSAMLESGRGEAVGRLRVSAPALFGRRCVAPILVELVRKHPRLEIEMSFTDRSVDLIEESYDLVVRNGPLGTGSGFIARRVAHQAMVVCASPAYLEILGDVPSIDSLPRHDGIVYLKRGRIRRWIFPTPNGPPLEIEPNHRLRFDDLGAIADAAAAGMGLAWLPRWLVEDRLSNGELTLVLERQPQLIFDTHALWPEAPHLPHRVRVAIDALAAELPGRVSLPSEAAG